MSNARQTTCLCFLLGFLMLALACHEALDMEGFPCTDDSDCLQLSCNQGRCGINAGPPPEPTKPDGTTPPDTPIDTKPIGPKLEYQPCHEASPPYQNKGVCKAGFINPNTNKCEGAINPQQNEICNGVDDNCDGQVDFDLDVCCLTEKKEVCDGKDNTCNGLIDEDFPGKGESCDHKSQGCGKGNKICYRGKETCVTDRRVEICSNGIDEDCDGTPDQEHACGYPHHFATISKRNQSTLHKSSRGISRVVDVKETNTHEFTIIKGTKEYSCQNHALILTPRNNEKLFASYSCEGDDFKVSIRNAALKAQFADGFYAVRPIDKQSGSHWGRVDVSTCKVPNSSCKVVLPFSPGFSAIRLKDKIGHFRIKSGPCKSSTQPVFATVFQEKADGFALIRSLGGNTCEVQTYDSKGQPADRNFAFWVPNPNSMIWVTVAIDGTILASHGNHPKRPWSVKVKQSSEQVSYELQHPTVGAATAVLVNPFNPAMMVANIQPNETPKRLYTFAYDPYAPGNGKRKFAAFSMMLVH